MRNKKPICLSAILCLAMALILPGCTEAEKQTPPVPAFMEGITFPDPMELSIGYWNLDNMLADMKADALEETIGSLFHVTFKPVSVSWINYKERYQMLSATGSLPDIFATLTISSNNTNDSATYESLIASGAVRPLPEDLSCYPKLNALFEQLPYLKYKDGRYYAIPRISIADPILGSTDAAMLVRRDWMDNLNLSDPQSLDEFIAMITAFAKDDPDGNGVDDTIGYNVNNLVALGKWVMLGIAPECNVYSWIEKDGSYVPSWSTEAFKEVVAAYRTMYVSGGLDPEFHLKTPTAVVEDFAAGRLGALEYKTSPGSLLELKTVWDAYNDLPFEECVDVIHIFPAADGTRYSNSSNIFWSESFISSSVSDEKLERILSLIEYLLSDEGVYLTEFGLEGTDYELTDAGEYRCLLDTGSESLSAVLNQKYPSRNLFLNLASWNGGWMDFEEHEMNFKRYSSACVKLANKNLTWNQENTVLIKRPTSFLMFPMEASELYSTDQAFEQFIKCIIGTKDPVIMWENAMEAFQTAGLDDYIARQNKRYQNASTKD